MNRITAWLRRFMAGRYGTDKLNMAILGVGLVCAIITMFVSNPFVALTLTFLSYGCMIWAIFRSFSRNVYKRYQENHRFLLFFDRLKTGSTGSSSVPGAVRWCVCPVARVRSPSPAPNAGSGSSRRPESRPPA
jgi:hypothetical protein